VRHNLGSTTATMSDRLSGAMAFKAEETAHHRDIGFYPSLGQKAIAESLKRDVRFLRPRRLEKVPVRHELGSAMAAMSDRLARAMAFKPLQPLDGRGFADRVMTTRRPAAHLAPLHRVEHPVAQILRIRLAIPAGLRPAGRLNQNLADSGIPLRVSPSAGRSRCLVPAFAGADSV